MAEAAGSEWVDGACPVAAIGCFVVLLAHLSRQPPGALRHQAQVLHEFHVSVTKELGVEPLTAKAMLGALRQIDVVMVDPDLIGEAVDRSILNRLSFGDALIMSAAARAKCQVLWSEDLNPGQKILQAQREAP